MGVRVSFLCAGVIRTPILEGGKYGKMLIDIPPEKVRQLMEKLKPIPPELFAEKALKSVEKNKAIIIVPSWWKRYWWMDRLSPSLGIFLSRKHFQKVQKELGIEIKRP